MTRPVRLGAMALFLSGAALTLPAATSNLNLSKNNLYRMKTTARA